MAFLGGESERRRALRAFLIERRREVRRSDETETGLSQADVAERAGVSLNWYELFESGREDRRVSPDFVERVAGALQLEGSDKLALFELAFPEGDALASIRQTTEEGALAMLASIRDLSRTLAEARDFDEIARRVAEAMHAAAKPTAATVTVLGDGDELHGFALGERAEFITEATYELIWRSRAGLPADRVALVERIPRSEELLREPMSTPIIAAHEDEREVLTEWQSTPEMFRDKKVYPIRSRSSLALPLFEGEHLRGLTVMYWTAPRTFSRIEIEAARAVAAIVQLVTRSSHRL